MPLIILLLIKERNCVLNGEMWEEDSVILLSVKAGAAQSIEFFSADGICQTGTKNKGLMINYVLCTLCLSFTY